MYRYVFDELRSHFRDNRQMVFLSGPRQVGKTTMANTLGESFPEAHSLSWDNQTHREIILGGPEAVASQIGMERLRTAAPFCAFDELHKYQHWRDFLKGFFDVHGAKVKILVTGSAALETFRRGGDSLVGRYFGYRLHPVSVAECTLAGARDSNIRQPTVIDHAQWEALWHFGGFPEPFLKADQRFYNRWRQLRSHQLLREDLRDLTRIQELGQVEMLAELLRRQVGSLTSYSSLAKSVRVSIDTIRRWTATLNALYYSFSVKPWHKNIARALRKEPKYFLWDWSLVQEPGTRAENFVACALLKAVNWWTDRGQGEFDLHFVRDKQKREVDFLVARNSEPWFLVEVKTSRKAELSKSLGYFQQQTGAQHAFQLALDAEFVERDCFEEHSPTVVPAKTFLSQLV